MKMKRLNVPIIMVCIILLVISYEQRKQIRLLQDENIHLLIQLATQHPKCRLFQSQFPNAKAQAIKGIVQWTDSTTNPKYVCDYIPWVTNAEFRRVEGNVLNVISETEFTDEVMHK